ncbi:MAG: hypothetical protein WCH78_13550 [Bacteroidota bacterium]
MRKIKILITFFSTCLIISSVKAQNLDSTLTNYYQQASFEKAYVHFDNNRYAAGQTIWYKAYLLSGFEPSLISKNFYIDWYDDQGKLISSTISPINYAYSSGNFQLPEKYQGKFIQAIAYTKWMRNFDSAYFFKQKFPIITAASKQEKLVTSYPETIVQFLPESGNLLLNKQNVIAFKAVNQSGLPQPVNGIIKNKAGDSITSFKSIHDGMGKFLFLPISSETYIAEWKDIIGNIHQTKLPEASEGVNLVIESGSTNRAFHIQRTSKAPESMKNILLVGQMNGKVLFKANINLSEKESISSTLPISKITSGILQLTLFDNNKQAICERLIFVKNNDWTFNASVKSETLNTLKKGKNVVEIELKDSSYANLSLAITDADLNRAPENNIASQLLLQGDLTGNIYQPAYYFSSFADSISNHLDLVMLTNGWRRFKWNTILNNPSFNLPFTKDSAYQTLIGKIDGFSNKKNSKTPSINLILSAKDSSEFMLTVPIQSDGSFSAKNVVLYDTTKIFYTLNDKTLTAKTKVRIDNDFYKVDHTILFQPVETNIDTIGLTKYLNLIEEQKRVELLKQKTTLKEVTVYAKEKTRIKQLDVKYTQGLFSTETKNSFDMSTMQNASHTQSIFDFLTGKVPGLTIGNSIGGIATENVVNFRGGEVSFYLNEVLIPTSDLPSIDVGSIAYIKVFDPPFAGAETQIAATGARKKPGLPLIASSAAIAMYTKIGGDQTEEKTKYNTSGMDYQMLAGYAPVKEFYVPSYAEKEQSNAIPDLRTTLLWNPWINLDKTNNKAIIRFYNNDITHSFRIILEGMDSKGKLIHISQILK